MRWLCSQNLAADQPRLAAAVSNVGADAYSDFVFSVERRLSAYRYVLSGRADAGRGQRIVFRADLPDVWSVQNEFSLRTTVRGLQAFSADDLRAMRVSLYLHCADNE